MLMAFGLRSSGAGVSIARRQSLIREADGHPISRTKKTIRGKGSVAPKGRHFEQRNNNSEMRPILIPNRPIGFRDPRIGYASSHGLYGFSHAPPSKIRMVRDRRYSLRLCSKGPSTSPATRCMRPTWAHGMSAFPRHLLMFSVFVRPWCVFSPRGGTPDGSSCEPGLTVRLRVLLRRLFRGGRASPFPGCPNNADHDAQGELRWRAGHVDHSPIPRPPTPNLDVLFFLGG